MRAAVEYFEAWLTGTGAAAIDGLMEDAATAEISRCQITQWLRHITPLADGGMVTGELVSAVLDKELLDVAPADRDRVRALFEDVTLSETPPPFETWSTTAAAP